MKQSIVPTFLMFKDYPKSPKVNDHAFSIIQDMESDVPKKTDKAIWKLYEQAEKKLGRLGAYKQINDCINYTEKDRLIALEKIQKCEAVFIRILEFHSSNKYYTEVTQEIFTHLKVLYNEYQPIKFESFLKQYKYRSYVYLIDSLIFVDEHIKTFKKIPRTQLDQKAIELKNAILHFDYMHIFYTRLIDLLELIKSKDIVGKINEGEFIRDLETIKKFNSSKKGPTVDKELYYDIERIFDQYLADDFTDKDAICHKDGKPIISKIVDLAIQDEDFGSRWSSEYPSSKNTKKGYDKRTLENHFSELYQLYEKYNT
jgi:hypothetical protein